jgi:hypothetical protein
MPAMTQPAATRPTDPSATHKAPRRASKRTAAATAAAPDGPDGGCTLKSHDGSMSFTLRALPRGTRVERTLIRVVGNLKPSRKVTQLNALSRLSIVTIVPDLAALDRWLGSDDHRFEFAQLYCDVRREFLAMQPVGLPSQKTNRHDSGQLGGAGDAGDAGTVAPAACPGAREP